MRFYVFTLIAAALVACAGALAAQKAVIVTYPPDTPQSVLEQAMESIREAGGVVTHEYKLLKGFAAKASSKTLEVVKTLENEYLPVIEEDSIVSVDGGIL